MIKLGESVPDVTVRRMGADGRPEAVSVKDLLGPGKSVLFAVPGAFTPTCSNRHLPGFVAQADALKARGVDHVICMSVNDAFVMDAWGRAHQADGKVEMVADGNADLARALGLAADASGFGMGQRAQRFAMIVDGGKVTHLAVDAPGTFEASSAEAVLRAL
ncbi:MAG: peroxiredoxin [Alphaproteobacteria bacterium]